MKRTFLLLGLIAMVMPFAAKWENSGNIGFSLTQTAVNNMWAGGEQDSITGIATIDNNFVYESDKLNFKNNLQLQFGRSSTPNASNPPYHIVTEAADKIYFSSTLMYKFKKFLNPIFMVQYDSQFTEAFDPSLFTETFGIGTIFIDKKEMKLSTKLGIAARELYDNRTSTADDPDTLTEIENFKFNSGINLIADFEKTWLKMIKLKSEFRYFTTFNFDDYNIVWDNIVSASIWKFIGISLNVKWLFNKKIGAVEYVFPKHHQLLETLTITFNYSLF